MTLDERVLRIRVTHENTPKVTVRVPLGIARLARAGGFLDQLSTRNGIDLDAIFRTIEDMPNAKIIDVIDEKSGDHVEVFIESDSGAPTHETPLPVHQ
jgi:hypothetical protein